MEETANPVADIAAVADAPAVTRRILFLQGMATDFFARLGRALARRGHDVYRINFNGGDRLFWPWPGAVDYRDDLPEWPSFFERFLGERRITDIVLFGDCRPLHRVAIRFALSRRLAVHVFEEGHLRPNWVTLEQSGVNASSCLPRDPAWYRAQGRALPPWEDGAPVRSSFLRRAAMDVLYNLAGTALVWRYPYYRTHRLWPFYVEYASWLRRIARSPLTRLQRTAALQRIATGGTPYFVFPLQLEGDSQIRHRSPHGRMAPVIEQVIASFAAHAPADALLVVKEHPLDNAVKNWRSIVRRIAMRAGVRERVIYVAGGNLEALLGNSSGVVTVNSTTGFLGLSLSRPVIALGRALYDMRELTFRGGLDDFWRERSPPDPEIFDAFRRVVAHRTQLNGGFFSGSGVRLAVGAAVARIEGSPLDRAPADASTGMSTGIPAPFEGSLPRTVSAVQPVAR
jgi:capsular polysaccharide export protein